MLRPACGEGTAISDTTYYNLKAVVQLTGVPAASLRAWEKRYGVPTPTRKPNGHRVYSGDEVAKLLRVKALLAQGMSISQAAMQATNAPESPTVVAESERLRQELFTALERMETRRANQVCAEAFDLLTAEQFCVTVVRPSLPGLGAFGRTYLRTKLGALLLGAPGRPSDPLALVMAPDPFSLEPLLVAVFVSRRGFQVLYIEGDEVPDSLTPALVVDPRRWTDGTPPEQLFQSTGVI